MLEDKDIQKLKEELVTKEDLETTSANLLNEIVTNRKEINELKTVVRNLQKVVETLTISVDKLAKTVDDFKTEYVAITSQMDRHEKWIKQLAEKLGIKLEY